MRRALLITLLFGAVACHEPVFEPVLPNDPASLDRDVLALIERKIALVRAVPSEARRHASLGLAYEANEQWDEAVRCFDQALAMDDSQPLWLFHRSLTLHKAGLGELSLAALREAGRRLEKDPAVQHRLGHRLLQMGEIDEARAAFTRALAADPGQPDCLAGMAGVEIATEHWSEALTLAQRALAVDPSAQYSAYMAGLALQGLGRDEEARDFLATGMGEGPHWIPDALTNELATYRLTISGLMDAAGKAAAKGNHKQAAGLYEKVLARSPENTEAQNNMAACLIDLGQFDRAERMLEHLLRSTPDSFGAHLNYAALGLKRQDLEFARRHADLAVQLGGGIGRTHFMRAYVMMLQEDWKAAEAELLKTVQLDARNPQYFQALSEVLGKLDRVEEARKWCHKALEIDPKMVPARIMQFSLALRADDLAEAREALTVIEQLAPSDPLTSDLRRQIEERIR